MICHDCGQQIDPDELETLKTNCIDCHLERIFEAEHQAERTRRF
jgi:hypothetical protein